MTRLVLASASPARLTVLRQAGVDPLVIVSNVDEDALIAEHPGSSPERVVTLLAAAKAMESASRLPADVAADCVVVGCDSMLAFGDVIWGKPGTVEVARARWREMAGRTGVLHTGHSLIRVHNGVPTHEETRTAATSVRFAIPPPGDLDAYLASGEPLQVAGAFTLDGLGGWFVEGIDGDPSNVIGISLPLLRRLLRGAGVAVSDLWRAAR